MLHTASALRGLIAAPHHLAAQSGLAVLRDGGNAIEAMVAAAATIAVVYPHMNSLGGDGFWLIHEPGRPPVSIDGSGAAARQADPALYRGKGFSAMPLHGPLAACTVAGTVSGWQSALEISAGRWGGTLPLDRLLEDAIHYARHGFPVASALHQMARRQRPVLEAVPGFRDFMLIGGSVPAEGAILRTPALATTLELLARNGLDDFYRGEIARRIAADLARCGSPLKAEDLARHRPVRRRPLATQVDGGISLFNAPPPTQGLTALMILALVDRLNPTEADGFDHVHAIVEATKVALKVRNAHITDPLSMEVHPTTYLHDSVLDRLAEGIDRQKAAPWPARLGDGDTVYLCAADGEGRMVSFIQSVYHGFGSGVVLPETGILWHNRGAGFTLEQNHPNCLKPGRKPMHTLAPAMAKFRDGRVMAFGTMGGDGQPQTQAALFTRYARFGQSLQQAVSAPRWVLGKSYGDSKPHDLKLESRFSPALYTALERAGHEVAVLGAFEDIMGHAAAVVRHPDGLLEGAADPRSNGVVAAF